MNARVANAYFEDKKAIKEVKFDIKRALMEGVKKQEQIREFQDS